MLLYVLSVLSFATCMEANKMQTLNMFGIDTKGTNIEVEYNQQELTGEWAEYAAKITLDDIKTVIEGKGVTNNGNTITINSAGTYYITDILPVI